MRSVFGFLGVLLALISTGHSLSCIKCDSIESTSCDGPNITCSSDRTCGAVYTVTTGRDIRKIQSYTRDCVLKTQCGAEGSMSVINNVKYKVGTSCCDTDGCTPPKPKLPDSSIWANGVVCRTCASTDSDWCLTDSNLMCTGNETKCILARTVITGAKPSKAALRGCASKSICIFGTMSAGDDNDNVNVNARYSCTSGILDLYRGSTFPFTVAILLAKLVS